MDTILLEKKFVLEYIKDILNDIKIASGMINNAKYHHNTDYSVAPSILKYGVLSLTDLNKLGIKNYSTEFLKKMDDIESHINGSNAVSLSIVGLQDLYHNEDEYNPFIPSKVDFLISSDIKTCRSAIHYGNEFLSYESIGVDKLRAVDIRLLKLIELVEKGLSSNNYSVESVIEKYNCLKNIAITMKHFKLDIPIREMSYQNNSLIDVDKLSFTPKLLLK